jgi:hypothetical protein
MLRWFLILVGLSALAGCSAPSAPPDVTIAPGRYDGAFDAARDVLVSYRFELERVDARAGVITTRPKTTSGLASPWDSEQTTLNQEWEDFLNEQQRTVRITFELAEQTSSPAAGDKPGQPIVLPDLREMSVPIVAHVEVVLERVHHTGWRLQPAAMRFSGLTKDPVLEERGLWPSYPVAYDQDTMLARRLAEAIRRHMSRDAQRQEAQGRK